MNSTRPTISADPGVFDIVRNAAGVGVCSIALVMAALSAQRAGDRLTLLDQVVAAEEAAALGPIADRDRLIGASAESLRALANRLPRDPAAAAAYARVRLIQAQTSVTETSAMLAEAESYADRAAKAGAPAADITTLRAQIAMARGPDWAPAAAGFIAQSYQARALDAGLAPIRTQMGLRLWADLDAAVQARVQAETCLLLRTAPTLAPALEAAAIEAEAPLLPSDLAAWATDPACAPSS
jgi:hypothetical protein